MRDISKILIMELWGIGDVVMMSAILKPLRAAFPQAEICVLSQEYGAEILKENTEVDRFFVFKFPWTAFRGKYLFWRWDWWGIFRIITSLHREKFDLILDARGDPRNDVLSFLIGFRQRVVWKKSHLPSHRIDHWGEFLRYLGIQFDSLTPSIQLSEEERAEADKFLDNKFSARPKALVGIHPGAGQKIRCWPMARFQEVAARLIEQKIGVLVLAEPDGYGSEIARNLSVLHSQGDIRQLAALISQMDLLICNDTGVMHIASAVGTPVVAIFGPGAPDFIGPREAGEVVIKECPDRPCFDSCRRKSAECLEGVSVDDVWAAVLRQLDVIKGNS